MTKPLRLLLIEDSENDELLILRHLRQAGYDVTHKRVQSSEEFRATCSSNEWDVIIADYVLPRFGALQALEDLAQLACDVPLLVVSGAMGEETAVRAMQAGAHDYLMKSNLVRLGPAIERELEEAANRRERRRAEELAMRLGRILDRTASEILLINCDTLHIEQSNTRVQHKLGYSAEELLQLSLPDLYVGHDEQWLRAQIQPLIAGTRESVLFETVQRTKHGYTYPIEAQISNAGEEDAQLLVAVAHDISDRHRLQERERLLAEISDVLSSSLELRQMVRNLAGLLVPRIADWVMIDMLDEHGVLQRLAVSSVSEEHDQLVQEMARRFPPTLTRQRGVHQAVESGKPMLFVQISDEILRELSVNEEHYQLLQRLDCNSSVTVPLLTRGRTLGALTIIGCTQRRRYDEEDVSLAEEIARRAAIAIENGQLYAETQRALHTRDQFISIAAHELKTPITTIMGNAQLILRRAQQEGQISERNIRSLRMLSDQARRLNRMITALLDLSRIQNGAITLDKRKLDFAALLRRMVEEITPTLHNHMLVSSIPEDPVLLEGDELRLEQVVQNLVQNAIKYSPNGGTIEINLTLREEHIELQIRDEGVGIPAESLPNIFNRYYRGTNIAQYHVNGMGVGLYVVRELVTLHGGTIHVESVEGHGSTFSVQLPLINPAATTAQPRDFLNLHHS